MHMTTYIEENFNKSLEKLSTSSKELSSNDQYHLWGLYKQSTVGNNNEDFPRNSSLRKKVMWEAWKDEENKSKLQTMKEFSEYISKLNI